jgi:glycosyltransferase involved in cell wall biosynthesis
VSADRGRQRRIVLHLVSRLSVGGVENQLRLVCSHYDRDRIDPLVCCIREKDEIGKEIEKEGTEVIALGRSKVHRFDLHLVLQICRILKERGAHILRTHQYEANFYGGLAAMLAKTPIRIPSVHNIYRRRKWHRERLNHALARFSDRIVAVSECVKADVVRYDRIPAGKIQVIHNGIDPAEIQREFKEELKWGLGLSAKSRVVGTIGRMKPQKGQIYLLEAFAALKRRMDDLKLLIVGDGPLRLDLEQKAEELGIREEVCFAGVRRDVYPLLSMMDLFVLPSLWEGMGTVIVEAMAAQRPVLASDIPPLREVIPSSDLGVLVPPGDAKSLEVALEQLLRDQARSERMARLAREYAVGAFHIQKVVSRYQDLFTEMEETRRR